jgi:hypothetical protein
METCHYPPPSVVPDNFQRSTKFKLAGVGLVQESYL